MYPCRDLVARVFTSCMITFINGAIAGKIISVTIKKQRGFKTHFQSTHNWCQKFSMRIYKWILMAFFVIQWWFCELCSNNLVPPWCYSLQENLGEFLWYDKHTTVLRAACVIFWFLLTSANLFIPQFGKTSLIIAQCH